MSEAAADSGRGLSQRMRAAQACADRYQAELQPSEHRQMQQSVSYKVLCSLHTCCSAAHLIVQMLHG